MGVCDRRIYYLVLGTHPVIKPGNIVYRVRRGGFIHDYPVAVKNRVGLVIKEIKEKSLNTMFSLIRKLLSGFTNMTSSELEEKEVKMINFTTNIPALDKENNNLFRASTVLEKMGNGAGLTADEFYKHLALSEFDTEDFQEITLAAISIETMMRLDDHFEEHLEPTIH